MSQYGGKSYYNNMAQYKTFNYGRHFGKLDINRTGFFEDSIAGPFDPYQPPKNVTNERANFKAGKAPEFFTTKFTGIFVRKTSNKQITRKKREKEQIEEHIIIPAGPAKKHSTPGDWFGCIGKQPLYFKPTKRKEQKVYTEKRPNFKIKRNPLGGPGYVDICFSPYPKHIRQPYKNGFDKKKAYEGGLGKKEKKDDSKPFGFYLTCPPTRYFNRNPYFVKNPKPTYPRRKRHTPELNIFSVPFPKKPGGNNEGCFEKYPKYLYDPYEKKKSKKKLSTKSKKKKPKWISTVPHYKSKYTTSTIDYVTNISCNAHNFLNYTEQVFPVQ